MPRRQANYVEEGLIIVDLYLLHKRYREQNRSFDERAVRRYGSMLPRAIRPVQRATYDGAAGCSEPDSHVL